MMRHTKGDWHNLILLYFYLHLSPRPHSNPFSFHLILFYFISYFKLHNLSIQSLFIYSHLFLFIEQKYTGTGLSLLELPKKHVHTVLIKFKEAEAEAYKKLELYFAEQYTVCKQSAGNGVRE